MQCPKCEAPRANGATICPACGLVYEKFNPFTQGERERLREKVADRAATEEAAQQEALARKAARLERKSAGPAATKQDRFTQNHVPSNLSVCTHCDSVGTAEMRMPGNNWVEIVLYLFYIAPGIIYSVWRRKGKKQVCGECGSEELVPVRTQVGMTIATRQNPSITLGKPITTVSERVSPLGAQLLALPLLGFSLMLASFGLQDKTGISAKLLFFGLSALALVGALLLVRTKATYKKVKREGRLIGYVDYLSDSDDD